MVNFGWVERPDEVERLLPTLAMPNLKGNLPLVDEKKDTFLYNIFREVVKADPPKGPQKIGDCVSWGWGNLVNYVAALQIHRQLKDQNLLHLPPRDECTEADYSALSTSRAAILEQYEEAATEIIYAFSRVEIGGQRGSYSDGSTGIWASKAVSELGTLSRPYLQKTLGKGDYDPNRAKDWGAKGVPDSLEPAARQRRVKTVSLVTNFTEAATLIQNGYPVAICSNRGFTMTRDSDGFCRPSGVWNHCMLLVAVRFGNRPGCCISQSWGANTPDGPLAFDQPDNTFWADASAIDYILAQRDSFTGSEFEGYPAQDLVTWKH